MQASGSTAGVYQNVASTILVRVPCDCCDTFTVKNNTPTNPITVNNPSLTITRIA